VLNNWQLVEGVRTMEFEKFKKQLLDRAIEYGFENCAIEYEVRKSFQIKVFEGNVADYKNTHSVGLAFRGVFEDKMGYAFTEKIDENIIQDILQNAKFNAKIVTEEDKEVLYEGDIAYPSYESYNKKLEGYCIEDKINLAKIMEKEALELDKRVQSVDYCIFSTGITELYISNTLGLELYKKSNIALAYIGCRVTENGKIKSFGEQWFGNDLSIFDPKVLAKKAVEKAISYLDAQSILSRKYEVIISNEVMSNLLGALISNFYAEYVQKGFSILKDKIGIKVASDIITIKDDAIFNNNIGNSNFDMEGVSTFNKIVIEKGILKTYLHNLKSSKKDKTKPTGNGFKSSLKATMGTSAINFYIEPSDTTYQQMIESMNDGVIITSISGMHAGINSISCDFSLSADGFLVKNGSIIKAVEQITIAGNFFDMLKNVIQIGNDLKFNYPNSNGSFGSPSIKIKELDITGI
jgi:PmbA protein